MQKYTSLRCSIKSVYFHVIFNTHLLHCQNWQWILLLGRGIFWKECLNVHYLSTFVYIAGLVPRFTAWETIGNFKDNNLCNRESVDNIFATIWIFPFVVLEEAPSKLMLMIDCLRPWTASWQSPRLHLDLYEDAVQGLKQLITRIRGWFL